MTESEQPKINVYTCGKNHKTIIRDMVPRRITPMFITCPYCDIDFINSRAASSMYSVDQTLTPKWEWFLPLSPDELKTALTETHPDHHFDTKTIFRMWLQMVNGDGPTHYRKIHEQSNEDL